MREYAVLYGSLYFIVRIYKLFRSLLAKVEGCNSPIESSIHRALACNLLPTVSKSRLQHLRADLRYDSVSLCSSIRHDQN